MNRGLVHVHVRARPGLIRFLIEENELLEVDFFS